MLQFSSYDGFTSAFQQFGSVLCIHWMTCTVAHPKYTLLHYCLHWSTNAKIDFIDNLMNLPMNKQVEKNNHFRREGADIHSDVDISLSQAVLGGTIRVRGLYEDILYTVSWLEHFCKQAVIPQHIYDSWWCIHTYSALLHAICWL